MLRRLPLMTLLLLSACAGQPCPPGDDECVRKQEKILHDAVNQREPNPLQTQIDRVSREVR